MKAVVTRVKSAAVTIEGKETAAIGTGYLVLLGVGPEDTRETAERLAEKIVRLRVFEDEAGRMNKDIGAVCGHILVVSQFTLYASLRSRRPGFSRRAARACEAALRVLPRLSQRPRLPAGTRRVRR